jgi:CspA family cold shock protein
MTALPLKADITRTTFASSYIAFVKARGTKQASGSAKIDPLMAAFNAIALMATKPWSVQQSIYSI